jgi:hypothetical protein
MKKAIYYPFALVLVLALAAGSLVASAQEAGQSQSQIYIPIGISGLSVKGVTACLNGLANSGFENDTAWEIPITAYSAAYSTAQAHTGARSMRTGITLPDDDRYSYSDARQVVTIPSDAVSVTLRMWIYSLSAETSTLSLPERFEGTTFGESALTSDVQYVIILDRYGRWIDTLLWQRSNARAWQELTFDLARYRGQTIKIQFGTYNDGLAGGGISALYVDDAYLEICTSTEPTPTGTPPTATITPTPTNTVTPPPTGCYQAVSNGGFETTTAWHLPITAYTASYSSAQVRSGSFALRTGITNPVDNRYSYSSGQQLVTIPAAVDSAILRFWAYQSTTENPTSLLSDLPPTFEGQSFTEDIFADQAILAGDVQYALILDSSNNWIGTLIWQRTNPQRWTEYVFNLSQFRGMSIKLHFGTYNDGYYGITSMYVDDVSLEICPSGGVSPTPTVTPTPTTTTTPSAACYNALSNSSFEATSSWLIPLTAYSAGYTSTLAHTGARSMRTGITLAADNRYSYSDAAQVAILPANLSRATLRLWAYQTTTESLLSALPATLEGTTFGEEAMAGDVQYVLVLDRYNTWIDTLLWQKRNTGAWTEYAFDLTAYKGWYLRLQFGTYNDGLGGITSMHVDDMTLEICP